MKASFIFRLLWATAAWWLNSKVLNLPAAQGRDRQAGGEGRPDAEGHADAVATDGAMRGGDVSVATRLSSPGRRRQHQEALPRLSGSAHPLVLDDRYDAFSQFSVNFSDDGIPQ